MDLERSGRTSPDTSDNFAASLPDELREKQISEDRRALRSHPLRFWPPAFGEPQSVCHANDHPGLSTCILIRGSPSLIFGPFGIARRLPRPRSLGKPRCSGESSPTRCFYNAQVGCVAQ